MAWRYRPCFPSCIALFVAAVIVVIIGGVDLHFTVLVFCFTVAGIFSGMIRPARDMMIRNAALRGAMGAVAGEVGANRGGHN